MIDLLSSNLIELEAYMVSIGEKKFRAKQVFEWLHKKKVSRIEDMSNLPAGLRDKMLQDGFVTVIGIEKDQISGIDGTRKVLFSLSDGEMIESVFMQYEHGNSVCISTQAGCRMGCTFCASGLNGLVRNLTAGEMLGQIYELERLTGERVSHVVLMGTGEPLDNYEASIKFIRLLSDPLGHDISTRHITLSTCGLVDKIDALALEGLPITLAVSLHASTDDVRKRTMPIAKKYSIAEILYSCEQYFLKTGRRITFEYALIKGVNDSVDEAKRLAKLLSARKFKAHVNLIPINTVLENGYESTPPSQIKLFAKTLSQVGVEATIRRSLGGDIAAACGQLRLSHKD